MEDSILNDEEFSTDLIASKVGCSLPTVYQWVIISKNMLLQILKKNRAEREKQLKKKNGEIVDSVVWKSLFLIPKRVKRERDLHVFISTIRS